MDPAVDAYIAALPPLRQARLKAVRELVHRVAPGVSERIEWKMPVFSIGDRWVAAASQKSWVSVYLGCEARAAAVIATDPALKGGKACVNITDRAALPEDALALAVAQVFAG